MEASKQCGAAVVTLGEQSCGFSLDRQNQRLWCGETPVNIPPKVFQLLVYLRDNPGRIIDYDELLDAVWPREPVQPEILKTYIKTIRRLLGDDPQHPKFIETRTRCGYCFIGKLPDRCIDSGASVEPLIGREDGLKTLRTTFGTAAHGRRQLVFVLGEAGIGKTRLLDEFISWSGEQDALVSRIDCAPAQHGAQSTSPIRDLALDLARLAHEVGIPAAASSVGAADSSEAVWQLVDALARQRPLVLVIEDLQWADPAMIGLISRLAYGRLPARLMIVTSYRAATPAHLRGASRTMMLDLVVHGVAQELRLTQLSTEDIKRYVLAHSTVPMAKGSIEAISSYSVGNPLIMSALAHRMIDEIRSSGTSPLIEMLSRKDFEGEFLVQAVPKIIRQALELQLGQLGEQACRVLESGSTSGFSFCTWGVAKVLDAEQMQIEDLCRSMCGSDQMLREAGVYVFPDGSVTPIYAFRNRLHACLLLAAQSHARREYVHQRFIQAVEQCWGDEIGSVAAEMTERFEIARDWSRALHYAKLAVANAKKYTSGRDTVTLLEKGLSLTSHVPEGHRAKEMDFFLRQLSELS